MSSRDDLQRAMDRASRRAFLSGMAERLLGVAAVPFLGPLLPGAALTAPPRQGGFAQRVIYLFMAGGMTHLDTFDPKPGREVAGKTEAIATRADGVQVGAHFRETAKHMDKVCVVSGLSSTQGAHQQAQYFMHTSYQLRGTIVHPSMGAWLDHLGTPALSTLPGHVLIGGGERNVSAGFLPSRHGPLPIGDPEAGLAHGQRHPRTNEETFARRLERLKRLNADFEQRYPLKDVKAYGDLYAEAARLMGSEDLEAFDLSKEPEALREAYGETRIGEACLLARRLVEHDVRYVEVTYGGWDTHANNFDEMDDLCPPLDRALAALLADLESRGLLQETLVVLATEFGRTPDINPARDGRDHYPKAFSCLLAGGGVRGGQRYGATDPDGREVIDRQLSIPDFNATIAWALGLPLEKEIIAPSGRPFRIADKGIPATELFA